MKKRFTAGRAVCYLLILTAVCTLFGMTYSRYSTQMTGTGTADVAVVSLDNAVDLSARLSEMTPGDTRAIKIQVSNEKGSAISEVTQRYSITINTTGNLPLTYTLTTEDAPDSGHALTPSKDSLIWSGGVLPHTSKIIHTYTLSVSWPSDKNDPKYASDVDAVRLVVDSQQIDK